ncbi:MAG: hypothetical protein Q8P15_03595 [Nanoarchaeota archaeon]|nr:hypothetical protein [Nanoarchaeota archaeon]
MKKTNSLGETKRKNNLLEKRDKLMDSKIRESYNKELKRIKKREKDEAEIIDDAEGLVEGD